jgi:hypothetical protein
MSLGSPKWGVILNVHFPPPPLSLRYPSFSLPPRRSFSMNGNPQFVLAGGREKFGKNYRPLATISCCCSALLR